MPEDLLSEVLSFAPSSATLLALLAVLPVLLVIYVRYCIEARRVRLDFWLGKLERDYVWRVGKCPRITATSHRVSTYQRIWRDVTAKSAYRLWKRQRGIRAIVRERTARSRMPARPQPTKNDGSHRRTNPELASFRQPA